MATTQITPDKNTVLAEIFIAAPPDRVFQALTDPKQMSQWWGPEGPVSRDGAQGRSSPRRQMVRHRRQRRWQTLPGRWRVSGDRATSPAGLYLEPKFRALAED